MKKHIQFLSLAVISFFFIVSCQSTSTVDTAQNPSGLISQQSVAKAENEISVMTYNVENLFDTLHDKGTEDFSYLPLKDKNQKKVQDYCKSIKNNFYKKQCLEFDWSDEALEAKMRNLNQVIRFTDQGRGPDNIMLTEVENLRVLKQFVNGPLSDLGYKTVVLIEGPDLRGIDPAFISKFPQVGKAKLHLIPYKDKNPEQLKWARRSRGILEVVVKAPNGKNITFLTAHFPSQSNPTEWRAQAIDFAKNLMLKYQKQGRAVVFGGDLNIIASEEETHGYFKTQMTQAGQVSHLVGCQHCVGSYNYKGTWSFLDILVFSNNLKSVGFELIPESIQIVKTSVNTDTNGSPQRFDSTDKTGAADHFPLYARLKYF